MNELEDGRREPERTEIISGEQATTNAVLDFISKAQKGWSDCGDKNLASIAMHVKPINDAIRSASFKGLKLKYLTEITKENIEDCKSLARLVELRHLDNVKINFAVSDTHYMAATLLSEGRPVPQVIYSSVGALVEQQRYVFDALWQKAIPASDRISELEEGIEPEFVEVITDGARAASLILDLANSVRKEARLILTRPKAMQRAQEMGVWDALIDSANKYGAEIEVIGPLTQENAQLAKEIMSKAPSIKILSGAPSTMGLFIQDKVRYLRIEEEQSDADAAEDAIGRVIYSNSKTGVKSFKSFFETLLKQSELYEQLREANEKLVVHDQLQKEFINIAAHELRTPIQPIVGMADILGYKLDRQEGRDKNDGVWMSKEDIGIVIRNAGRLERLSSDILDIARIESGNLHLHIEELGLQDIILPAVRDAQSQMQNEIRIVPQIAPGITVAGDRQRLAQVISNLLGNAIKFTETGTITIDASMNKSQNQVIINVRDSGKGIDPDVLPRMFSKFVTKSEKGTGLGLFIARNIVEAHGGRIWGENNRDGRGATFTFTLPMQPGPTKEEGQ